MKKRSVIDVLDLSVEELDQLVATANDIIEHPDDSCSMSPRPGPA